VATAGDYLGDGLLSGAKWLSVGPGGGLVAATDTGTFEGLSYLPDRSNLKGPALRWGDTSDTLGLLDTPRRVATSSLGDVFIVDRNERVQHWSAAGNPLEQWDVTQVADVIGGSDRPCYIRGTSTGCLGPARTVQWDMAAPADGWLTSAGGATSRLAAVDLANQRVVIYDRANQKAPTDWSYAPGTSFVPIADVAMDDNNVYLVNRGTHHVEVYSLTGQLQSFIAVPGEALRVATADGAIYALTRDNWIYKYDAAHTLKAAFEAAPKGAAADLAVGPNGRVYVADGVPFQSGTQTIPGRVLVFEPGGSPPTSLPTHTATACDVTVDKQAAPGQVYLGDQVTVQLAVHGTCPPGTGQVDVALVLDESGSMSGAAIAAVQSAAISFLGELDPKGAQVAVIPFSTTATVLQPLTNNLRDVVRAVAKIASGGTTNYTDAMTKALGELTGPASRADVPHIVILMTDGNPTDRTDVMATADKLKAAGITIFTIGLGSDLDRDLLKQIATSADKFFEAPSETELAKVYTDIALEISITRLLKSGTVMDELPADMDLVPASANPPAQVQGRTLTWQLTDVPITGKTLTYSVKPTVPGHRPTNVQATIDYVDATSIAGKQTFPVPSVDVLQRTVFTAYLPYLTKNRCRPQRADVVLVFDTSSSMNEPSQPGSSQTKMQAAIAAGQTFLSAMTLPGDQGAVVSFNTTSTLTQQLDRKSVV
jgi:Mg-chelatase subunit ChlD